MTETKKLIVLIGLTVVMGMVLVSLAKPGVALYAVLLFVAYIGAICCVVATRDDDAKEESDDRDHLFDRLFSAMAFARNTRDAIDDSDWAEAIENLLVADECLFDCYWEGKLSPTSFNHVLLVLESLREDIILQCEMVQESWDKQMNNLDPNRN